MNCIEAEILLSNFLLHVLFRFDASFVQREPRLSLFQRDLFQLLDLSRSSYGDIRSSYQAIDARGIDLCILAGLTAKVASYESIVMPVARHMVSISLISLFFVQHYHSLIITFVQTRWVLLPRQLALQPCQALALLPHQSLSQPQARQYRPRQLCQVKHL